MCTTQPQENEKNLQDLALTLNQIDLHGVLQRRNGEGSTENQPQNLFRTETAMLERQISKLGHTPKDAPCPKQTIMKQQRIVLYQDVILEGT